MKIVEVTGMTSTKYGGIEKFFIGLMKSRPNDEFVLTYNTPPQSSQYVKDVEALGGKIVIFNTLGMPSPKKFSAFKKLMKKEKADIVHFHFGSRLYAYAAKSAGAKINLTTYHSNMGLREAKWFKRQLKKIYFWLQLRKMKKILFVSNYIRSEYEHYFGKSEKLMTSYLGVPKGKEYSEEEKRNLKESLDISKDEIVISNISFATEIKAVDVLIKAIAKIKNRNVKVILIGLDESIPLTQKWRALAKELGIEDKFIWTGIVNNAPAYLAISDIYAHPCRNEGLGLVNCEAASYKVPSIGADSYGLPEVCSILFKTDDVDDLAQKIDLLIEDPDLRKKLGQESYEKWEKIFNLDQGAKAYSDIYDELLAKYPSKRK